MAQYSGYPMIDAAQNSPEFDTREEYRTIESALLETARGRWFLAEHGRRARRLDSAMLEDAIGKLQNSIRQPPALLGQLQGEIETIRAQLQATRTELLKKAAKSQAATADDAANAGDDGDTASTAAAAGNQDSVPMDRMLKAAENVHELAWGLQAQDIDPDACEALARQASALYALSMHQATYSTRILKLADVLDSASARIEGILQTIGHELQVDGEEGEFATPAPAPAASGEEAAVPSLNEPPPIPAADDPSAAPAA